MTLPSNEELQRLLDEATPGTWAIDADSDPEVVARTSAPSSCRRWIGEWEEA